MPRGRTLAGMAGRLAAIESHREEIRAMASRGGLKDRDEHIRREAIPG